MAKVSISINGRKYALGCDDGEEQRLIGLGNKLDARVRELADQFGQIGDLRLMVMVGITLLDELSEFENNIASQAESLSADMKREGEEALAKAKQKEITAADSLLDAAMRIEKLSEKLSRGEF